MIILCLIDIFYTCMFFLQFSRAFFVHSSSFVHRGERYTMQLFGFKCVVILCFLWIFDCTPTTPPVDLCEGGSEDLTAGATTTPCIFFNRDPDLLVVTADPSCLMSYEVASFNTSEIWFCNLNYCVVSIYLLHKHNKVVSLMVPKEMYSQSQRAYRP